MFTMSNIIKTQLKNKNGQRTVVVEQIGNQIVIDGAYIYGQLSFNQVIKLANENGYFEV